MKIAKKVLAVVMAVAMIAALSAMAFAETKATIALTVGEADADGNIPVTVSLKDAEGFKSGDATVTFDPTVLQFVPKTAKMAVETHSDFKALGDAGNSANLEANDTEAAAGKLIIGFYFKEDLSDLAGWGVDADVNNFGVCVLKFKALKADAEASLAVEGKLEVGDEKNIEYKTTAVVSKAAPVTESTSVEVKTEGESTTNPGTGDDKKTGDNMALAAAAGVVVLAGAAFIISKKRK